jgi:uncharacterized cupredoxin-like copper-binding protein
VFRRLLALSLVTVAASACSQAAAVPAERTVQIRIHYSAFSFGHVEVSPGETIRFIVTNADPIDHEFIVGDQALQVAHELGTEAYHPPRPGEITIRAGETGETSYTFGDRDLLFGCHLPGHYAYGMRGSIAVA